MFQFWWSENFLIVNSQKIALYSLHQMIRFYLKSLTAGAQPQTPLGNLHRFPDPQLHVILVIDCGKENWWHPLGSENTLPGPKFL